MLMFIGRRNGGWIIIIYIKKWDVGSDEVTTDRVCGAGNGDDDKVNECLEDDDEVLMTTYTTTQIPPFGFHILPDPGKGKLHTFLLTQLIDS